VIAAIEAMRDGSGKVFFALGGNFAVATPDSERTAEALRNCELTVHVATKLNRSHLVHGKSAFILPCLGRTEIDVQKGGSQGVTVEDSMSMVHISTGMNPPASKQLMSEPAIVAKLAAATLPNSRTPWLALIEDYDRIRDRIAQVVDGFADFNKRVHVPGGFYLGNTARERRWQTATGKATFRAHRVPTDLPVDRARREAGTSPVFNLMTIRSHDQYNTTIYGLDDRYRGVFGHRRVCFINGADIAQLGFKPGEWVDMSTVWHDGERRVERFLLVEYDIPRGCIASYYPETNPLVPLDNFADEARTPASKSIPVRLARSAAA
jgi:molybdopterin-dependent oxidoreductase alpha subunit